jgi:two-component system, OmpR family, phosphate regulon sensor histidine kinase PhoR
VSSPVTYTERRQNGLFRVLWQGRTYRTLLYLGLAFPLGWAYWILFSQGFKASADAGLFGLTLFVLLVMASSWYVVMFERWLARWLLGVQFMPMVPQAAAEVTLWERVKAHLRNPVTWKALVYLGFRMLFGIVVPVAALALLALCFALILAPAWYVAAVAVYGSNAQAAQWIDQNLTVGTPQGIPPISDVLGFRHGGGHVEPGALAISLVVSVLGVFALLGVLHLLKGVVWLWGRFARTMLGMSQKDLWLAEAHAIATRERARADQADRSRRELILNASHELRTPIASIRAHIESLLILQGDQLPEHVRGFLAITQREAERLGTLIDDLLMLARSDADELRLNIQPVAAGEVVEEVYQALEPLAQREREVTLVRTVAADLPPALADRDRLAQVLLNLVRNAITYTPRGGVVSVDLEQSSPGYLALTVTDTGIGVPPEELERVFDRFYRTDASRARGTGGSGLGLSIVRDLVEAMGGSVAAERVPEGGSRFRVELRAAQVEASSNL